MHTVRHPILNLLLTMVAAALVAAGCGGDDDDGSDAAPATPPAEVGATGAGGALEDEQGASVEIEAGVSSSEVYDRCIEALEGTFDNPADSCRVVQNNYDDCEQGPDPCAALAEELIAEIQRTAP